MNTGLKIISPMTNQKKNKIDKKKPTYCIKKNKRRKKKKKTLFMVIQRTTNGKEAKERK
jgi:hypothetical protein